MRRRSTFRRRSNPTRNDHIIGRRNLLQNENHYAALHDTRRQRSASEIEAIQLAAVRRPHGWAAAFIGAVIKPKRSQKKAAA